MEVALNFVAEVPKVERNLMVVVVIFTSGASEISEAGRVFVRLQGGPCGRGGLPRGPPCR